MFANGMSKIISSATGGATASEDGILDETNAGMELSLLGQPLRPFVFFESAADIMSMYWSGKLGERLTALQGTQLLQDGDAWLPLPNGLAWRSQLRGCVSYDFSGKAEVSLSAFALLFSELVQYCQSRSNTVPELQTALHSLGWQVGAKYWSTKSMAHFLPNRFLVPGVSSQPGMCRVWLHVLTFLPGPIRQTRIRSA